MLDHSALVRMDGHGLVVVLLGRLKGVHIHGVSHCSAQICLLAVRSLIDEGVHLVLGILRTDALLVEVSLLNQFVGFAREYLLRASLLDICLGCPKLRDVFVAFVGCLVKVTLTIELGLRQLEMHLSQTILALRVHCGAVRICHVRVDRVATLSLAWIKLASRRGHLDHAWPRVPLPLLTHPRVLSRLVVLVCVLVVGQSIEMLTRPICMPLLLISGSIHAALLQTMAI